VYRIIQESDGAVIKTIGDAVMASFPSSLKGLQASQNLQEYFTDESDPGILKIRTTLHTGPCLAVNLNSNIDYFGNTVNLAAKLQKDANAREIVFTESIFRDKEVRNYLLENGIKLRRIEFLQEWNKETIRIYKMKVSGKV
jgi:class 3 adenylate cyclase